MRFCWVSSKENKSATTPTREREWEQVNMPVSTLRSLRVMSLVLCSIVHSTSIVEIGYTSWKAIKVGQREEKGEEWNLDFCGSGGTSFTLVTRIMMPSTPQPKAIHYCTHRYSSCILRIKALDVYVYLEKTESLVHPLRKSSDSCVLIDGRLLHTIKEKMHSLFIPFLPTSTFISIHQRIHLKSIWWYLSSSWRCLMDHIRAQVQHVSMYDVCIHFPVLSARSRYAWYQNHPEKPIL